MLFNKSFRTPTVPDSRKSLSGRDKDDTSYLYLMYISWTSPLRYMIVGGCERYRYYHHSVYSYDEYNEDLQYVKHHNAFSISKTLP
jgi:hypothetical protein